MTTPAARAKASKATYTNAKKYAQQQLGGPQAYWVVGPALRRNAVAAALLQVLFQQDESIAASTVRWLLDDLYSHLTSDTDFQ